MNLAGTASIGLGGGQLLRYTSQTLAADFITILTASPGALVLGITTDVTGPASIVRIDAQVLGVTTAAGAANQFELFIDGVSAGFSRTGLSSTLTLNSVFAELTGLSAGSHTFELRGWTNGGGTLQILAATTPTTRRASLAVAEWSAPP